MVSSNQWRVVKSKFLRTITVSKKCHSSTGNFNVLSAATYSLNVLTKLVTLCRDNLVVSRIAGILSTRCVAICRGLSYRFLEFPGYKVVICTNKYVFNQVELLAWYIWFNYWRSSISESSSFLCTNVPNKYARGAGGSHPKTLELLTYANVQNISTSPECCWRQY